MDLDARLTGTQAAAYAGVSVATIRTWHARGHLDPVGTNARGRPMYKLLDVAKAEHATRRPHTRRAFAA